MLPLGNLILNQEKIVFVYSIFVTLTANSPKHGYTQRIHQKSRVTSGAAGIFNALPVSIQKALAIDPRVGSTYLDAEHVVILMQENRSFDHCFGSLQGVRGFNDPRAITKPDKNLVWMQTNAAGETYLPFRLNIKDTNATWIGSLPHSWTNHIDARKNGAHDKWLDAKRSGHKESADMPLTMGYYDREDLPFYYALADAFTVCDQNFCSSLTGTTPNRLFLWTGTIRETQDGNSPANVRNEEVDYGRRPTWKTFPERLEESGVSWNVYQNEISLPSGLSSEDDSRLSNFTDNQARLLTCMCRENICFNLRKLIIQNQKRNLEPGTTRYLLVIV